MSPRSIGAKASKDVLESKHKKTGQYKGICAWASYTAITSARFSACMLSASAGVTACDLSRQ